MGALIPRTIQPEPGTAPQRRTDRGSEFADLMRRVTAAGLLARRPGYYVTKIAVTGGLLVAAWTAFAANAVLLLLLGAVALLLMNDSS